MRRSVALWILVGLVAAGLLVLALWPRDGGSRPLRLGMAPYQDLAMIVNAEPLGLERRYGTDIELVTMGAEELLPSVASAGRGVDIAFGSYSEYLAKYNNLNTPGADPVRFIYPLYVFRGGGLVTFRPDLPPLNARSLRDPVAVSRLLEARIGVQRRSLYEMMVHRLAALNGIDPARIRLIDTPLDQGFLAAQQGSLDLAGAGLTQLTETERRGGHVVLRMDDLQFADITGFIVKESVLRERRKDIENLIRMWFDCVNYVFADIDRNSAASLAYLNRQASTRYSLEEYKRALSQEYLPRSIQEAESAFLSDRGRYPASVIRRVNLDYLVAQKVMKTPPQIPDFIRLEGNAQ